ncbi:hypothetical protein Tco_0373230 [Tanacetum coccineum]
MDEHVVHETQVHKWSTFQDAMRCAWLMNSRSQESQSQIQIQGTSTIQEVNITNNIYTREKSRVPSLKTNIKQNTSKSTHHEKQVEDILNYLDELSFHCIEKMEEGHINRMIIRKDSDELKIKLERICTQIIKLQKKKLGQKDKIVFAHYIISNLEQIIKEIQARHQTDQEDLYDVIYQQTLRLVIALS